MPKVEVDLSRRDAVEVQILDTFYVTVPFVSRVEQEKIREYAIPPQMRNLGVFAEPDAEKLSEAEAEAYIVKWRGLTPDIIEALAGPVKFHFEWNGDGTIPYDKELAHDLWRILPFGTFAQELKRRSHGLHRELYEQKKRQPRPSADTSAA